MITYLVALGSIAFIAVVHFFVEWLAAPGSSFRRQIITLGISFASLLPTIPLLVYYYQGSSFAGKVPVIDTGRIPDLLNDFISMRILVSFESFGQKPLSLAVAVLLGLLFIITLVKRISRISFSQRRFFRFEDCILALTLILFALYLLMPWDFGSGGWLNDRLILLACLFLLVWFDVTLPIFPGGAASTTPADSSPGEAAPLPFLHETRAGLPKTWFNRAYPPVMAVLFCLASLAALAGVLYSFIRIEPVLQEYVSGTELIKPNSVVLPLIFKSNDDFNRADPLLHANHYLTLTNGALNLGNYEPFVDYFPLKFKPNLNLPIYLRGYKNWNDTLEQHDHTINLCHYITMVDYLLVWDTPEYYFKSDIDQCYDLIYTHGRQKIYVPRR
jgi:hypothetical protein